MFNYSFNIAQFTNDLLATRLRKPRTLAWLGCLLKPVVDIHSEFVAFINEKRQDCYTSSTAPLEYYMRIKHSNGGPFIKIENINNAEPDIFIGREDDLQYEVIIGRNNQDDLDVFLGRNGPQTDFEYDFIIKLNDTWYGSGIDQPFKLSQIVATALKFRTVGRKFVIVLEFAGTLLYTSD